MGAFGGLILTSKGRALQAKVEAGSQLNFNRIAVGDGDLNGQSITDLNALISEKKSLSITKLKTQSTNQAVVGAVLSNQDIVTGFYFKELGVFAQDPDVGEILFCYGNAGPNAEYIPAGGGADVVEKHIDCVTIVGNNANVTATMDQSLIYIAANEKGSSNGVATLDSTGQVPSNQLGNSPVTSVNQKTGAITLAANDVGSYTKQETDNKINQVIQNLDWKEHIATYADIGTTYPNPEDGWTVGVDDEGTSYRYDATSATWVNIGITAIPLATQTVDGKMSHQDKAKLDGIEAGAQVNEVTANQFNTLNQTVTEHQADDVSHVKYGVATGTANTYAVTLDPTPTEYVEGMALSVKINVASTGASTINVNGLGAIPIKKANGTDVTNLKANGIYTLRYDGTNFILQGEGASGNATASDLLSGKTATTDAGEITGTMPNRGTFNLPLGASVPAGYYSGGNAPNGKGYASGTSESLAQYAVSNTITIPFTVGFLMVKVSTSNTDFTTIFTETGSKLNGSDSGTYGPIVNLDSSFTSFTIQSEYFSTTTYKWYAWEK